MNKALRGEVEGKVNYISPNLFQPRNASGFVRGIAYNFDALTEIIEVDGVSDTATTSSVRAAEYFYGPFEAGQKYTLSITRVSGQVTNADDVAAALSIYVDLVDQEGQRLRAIHCFVRQSNYLAPASMEFDLTADEAAQMSRMTFALYVQGNGATMDHYRFKVQVKEGEEVAWQPCDDQQKIRRDLLGKAAAGQLTTYNLPVSSGISRAPTCTYSIDPFGQLRIAGALKKSSPLAPGDVLGQLPVGYRPAVPAATEYVERPVTVGSLLAPALLRIYFDGRLELWGDALAGQDTVYLDVTLPAAD